MLYISNALSLYFPWDFCLYEGMTAMASHFFAYLPLIVAIIIIIPVLKYRCWFIIVCLVVLLEYLICILIIFIISTCIITNHVCLCRPHGYTSPKGRKFQEIYSKFRLRCAHGIWTLVLLMYMKVLYNAWLITDCIKVADNGLVSVL